MKGKRLIVDTTLRDGEQCPGIVFSMEDKLSLASILDSLNIFEIEAGIPCMGGEEEECVREIVRRKKNALISVWSRMKKEDIVRSVKCKPDIIHMGVPVSYVQIYSKMKKNKSWLQKSLAECLDTAKEAGVDVTVGFEDASRADVGFIINNIKLILDYGFNKIRIADTVGVFTPDRTAKLIHEILDAVNIEIEVHVHNDLGMAVANSVEAAKAGAKYIDCTLLGIGERSGNCNLYDFIFASEGLFQYDINKSEIRKAEKFLSGLIERGFSSGK